MSDQFGDLRDHLVIEDGRCMCPADGCEWWVPKGMEYLLLDHYQEHSFLKLLGVVASSTVNEPSEDLFVDSDEGDSDEW